MKATFATLTVFLLVGCRTASGPDLGSTVQSSSASSAGNVWTCSVNGDEGPTDWHLDFDNGILCSGFGTDSSGHCTDHSHPAALWATIYDQSSETLVLSGNQYQTTLISASEGTLTYVVRFFNVPVGQGDGITVHADFGGNFAKGELTTNPAGIIKAGEGYCSRP